MFDAQLLPTASDGTGLAVFSPWMPRQGDRLLATLDLILLTASGLLGSIEVKVYHKNSEDTTDGSAATGSITRNSSGRTTAEFGPLKELVRYRFSYSTEAESQQWALFRMLSLVWFDDVKA